MVWGTTTGLYDRAMNRGQILRNLFSCGAGGRDADWVSWHWGSVLCMICTYVRLIRPSDSSIT